MRNRIQFVLLFTALVVLGAACGSDGDASSGSGDVAIGEPATHSPDEPVSSPPNAGGDVLPGAGERRQVTAEDGLDNPVPTFIESYASIDDDTVELRFSMGVADCYGLAAVTVGDAADAVTVTVKTGSKPGAQVCIEIAELVATTVDLPTPLAGRPLIDGSTGDPIPVD
jgi:hypothetical protein